MYLIILAHIVAGIVVVTIIATPVMYWIGKSLERDLRG